MTAAYWLVVAPVLLVQYTAETTERLGGPTAHVVGVTVVFDTLTVAVLIGGLLPLFLRGRGSGRA